MHRIGWHHRLRCQRTRADAVPTRCLSTRPCSSQNAADQFTTNVRQPVVPAAVAIGEAFVVQAQQMENRGVEIVRVNGIADGLDAVFVGLAMDDATLHARASQP